MKFVIMDNRRIIEDFENLDDAMNNLKRVRKDNPDIVGDLLVVKIHYAPGSNPKILSIYG